MSTSPFVSKSMTGNTRLENDEPYSTIYIENLLGVLNIFTLEPY